MPDIDNEISDKYLNSSSQYAAFISEAPVWFVGAGPGDPELITIKGMWLISHADLVLYAGSLVPVELMKYAKQGALVLDSSSMTLVETHAHIMEAVNNHQLVARVHTGDPSLYGAMREQAYLLEKDGVTCKVIPGVSAAFAAMAAAGAAFTVPETVQSLSITRLDGRTPVPPDQSVARYSQHGGALAVYLSAQNPELLEKELRKGSVAGDTVILIGYRVGWPDEQIIWSTLDTLIHDVFAAKIKRQAVFIVLPGEKDGAGAASRLYAKDFFHGYRPQ